MTVAKVKAKPKAKAKPKKATGRPRTVIDWDTVDSMCQIKCTGEEQAAILGVDYDTLNTACKREKSKSFSDYIQEKSATGKMSLRRRQYTAAMDGNPTMLIWLGKNWLGQTDQSDEQVKATAPIINIINPRA